MDKLLKLLKEEGIKNIVVENGEIKGIEKVGVDRKKINDVNAFDMDDDTLMSTAALIMSCDGDIDKVVDKIWEVFGEAMQLGLKDMTEDEKHDKHAKNAILLNSYTVNTFKYTKALCAYKDNKNPKETAIKMYSNLVEQLKKELM